MYISDPLNYCNKHVISNKNKKYNFPQNEYIIDHITYFHFRSFKFHTLSLPLVAQRVKCLPAMQETWVWSLGREYPLEKEMATHSSILAWRIPWTEEPGGLQSTGLQRVGHDWATSLTSSNNHLGWFSLILKNSTFATVAFSLPIFP